MDELAEERGGAQGPLPGRGPECPVLRNALAAQLRGKVFGFPKGSFRKANFLKVLLFLS